MDFNVKLEGAGVLLSAIGITGPLEALQIMSAVAGVACGVLAIIKAGVRVYQLFRDLAHGDKTAAEVADELDDVADDLRAEVRDDEKE